MKFAHARARKWKVRAFLFSMSPTQSRRIRIASRFDLRISSIRRSSKNESDRVASASRTREHIRMFLYLSVPSCSFPASKLVLALLHV